MILYLDMSGSIPETRPLIASGSTLVEDNPLVSGNLSDGEFIENLSTFAIDMTGPKYIRYASSSYDCQLNAIELEIWHYDQDNPNYKWGRHTITIPFSAPGTTKSTATYTVDVSSLLLEWVGIAPWTDDDRSLKSPNRLTMLLTYKGISGDVKGGYITFSQDLTITAYKYIVPSMSSFTMNRALNDVNMTISNQGKYGRYDITSNLAAILASDEPSFIRNAAALTVSFTRNGSTVTHAAESDGIGLLQSGGAALELGNEETFTVTATLTDGINTVTMSALLSANFAIFNCNAAKNSVGIGKYCDGTFTGLDVNMAAKFRHDVTFDSIPFILPNMMECLWKKASPGTSQSAATVTLTRNLTAGEPVLVIWREWENSSAPAGRLYTSIGWAGHNVGLMFVATSSTNRNGNRTIVIGPTGTYASNQLRIEACEYNGSTNNAYGVVLALFAFKREWLNFQNTWDSYTAP